MPDDIASSTTKEKNKNRGVEREPHIRYFAKALHRLSAPYAQVDTNRLTMVHFAVHALDLLGVWDDHAIQQEYDLHSQRIIDWIYNSCCLEDQGGFQGGSSVGPLRTLFQSSEWCSETPVIHADDMSLTPYHRPHIAMTYCALLTLHVLGDDGARLPSKEAMLGHIRSLQREDGSVGCVDYPSESDLRFLYCACAISWILNDWSGMDQIKALQYIQDCVGYDGGIALLPGQESHGGSTFCGTAALRLMGRPEPFVLLSSSSASFQDKLTHWCVHRQATQGMQGRSNKLEDTCYSYWIGGTLRLLGRDDLLHQEGIRNFILSCQAPSHIGGFSKVPGSYPDILHSFYSLAWLSLAGGEPELHPLNATLGIRQDRVVGLQQFVGANSHVQPANDSGEHDVGLP